MLSFSGSGLIPVLDIRWPNNEMCLLKVKFSFLLILGFLLVNVGKLLQSALREFLDEEYM